MKRNLLMSSPSSSSLLFAFLLVLVSSALAAESAPLYSEAGEQQPSFAAHPQDDADVALWSEGNTKGNEAVEQPAAFDANEALEAEYAAALEEALLEEERAERVGRELAALEQANAFDELMERNTALEERELEAEMAEAARLAQTIEERLKEEEAKQPQKIEEAPKPEPKMELDVEESGPAQKKGQSEFVSFVEPPVARQRQSKQSFDKRRPVESVGSRNSHFLPHYQNNVVFVAIGTLLVVGVVGTVGSTIYLRRRRDSFDDSEFAPYSGTGPKLGASALSGGPKGDEALAYKAQLHHYQQAKQKIICGDELPPGVGLPGDSDEEDEENADEPNNFSVYECPGLAPTGDLEVHNPNFEQQE